MASPAKRILLAGRFSCLCRNADATEPSSLPPSRVPRLDGTELPLMLIHRAMTNGDRPDDAWSISQRSLKFGEAHQLKLMTFARIVSVRGEYRYLCCFCMPVPCRPLWQFLRCDMPHWDRPQHQPLLKTKGSQVNRQVAPNVIGVAVLRPCDRIRRRKTIKGIRPRILHDCPCGGDQHEYVQWQAQVAAPEQYWSQVPSASHIPMPRRSFRPAGSPAFTIVASSPSVAIVFLAGSLPDHHPPQLRHR